MEHPPASDLSQLAASLNPRPAKSSQTLPLGASDSGSLIAIRLFRCDQGFRFCGDHRSARLLMMRCKEPPHTHQRLVVRISLTTDFRAMESGQTGSHSSWLVLISDCPSFRSESTRMLTRMTEINLLRIVLYRPSRSGPPSEPSETPVRTGR